jgi:ribosomal protein L11 methyltransferase
VRWQQLILRLDAEDLPRAEALLRLAGAEAVSIADDADFPLLEPAPGELPIWPTVAVRALFPVEAELDGLRSMLGAALQTSSPPEIAPLTEADWIHAWRQRITAREFGAGLWVTPADAPDEPYARRQLRMHMGLAFGTGQHPTTALCLEQLTTLPLAGARVLDYGCGSGILALAALRLGAEYAWAVDNDPQAVAATADNASLNDLRRALWSGLPQDLPPVEADLILANIVAGTLVDLAPRFAARAGPRAAIVLSGILSAQRRDVQSAYTPYFEGFRHTTRDGWVCLVGHRKIGGNW